MKDDEVIGFQVVACHSRTAYSLHGCIDHRFKDYCPADLLLLVFRNIYGFELKGERIDYLSRKFKKVSDRFIKEIRLFLAFPRKEIKA